MPDDVEIRVRFTPEDDEVSRLHALAFGSSEALVQPWTKRLSAHSLTWVGAFDGDVLVGFVSVIWDGGTHAFLLETAAEPDHQRRGIGRSLVQTAVAESRAAGCAWLHVDYKPHLAEFYRDACCFRPTEAGLLSLR